EKSFCYAFSPIVDLIRCAQLLNIKVIIVSDIYFNQDQLRELLSHALPPDIMNSIQQIFCSSDYGKSKMNGLFTHVIRAMQCKPDRMLHIGDNITADYISARA